MKRLKIVFFLTLLSAFLFVSNISNDNYTSASYYKSKNDWMYKNGKWYYTNNDGVPIKNGWISWNGNWYFLDKNGVMVENGWHTVSYNGKKSFFRNGKALLNEWVKFNGKNYYIGDDCYLVKNKWVYDNGWTYLNHLGERIEDGLYKVNDNKKSYFRNGHAVSNEIVKIKGNRYYFNGSCYLNYYGWFEISKGNWMYSDKDGVVIENGLTKTASDGRLSYFENGIAVSNAWRKNDGKWYYFGNSCYSLKNEWVKSGSHWYYLGDNYKMLENSWVLLYNKEWAFVNQKGEMLTSGLHKVNGGKYSYFEGGEAVHSKWVKINGNWYYLKSNCYLATNEYIDGYYVNSNGVWIKEKDKRKNNVNKNNSHRRSHNLSQNGRFVITKEDIRNNNIEKFELYKEEVKREYEVLYNNYRKSLSLSYVNQSSILARGAHTRANEMLINKLYSHKRPNGEKFSTAFDYLDYDNGYRIGENIWALYSHMYVNSTPREFAKKILNAFINSPNHDKNLRGKYDHYYLELSFDGRLDRNGEVSLYLTMVLLDEY